MRSNNSNQIISQNPSNILINRYIIGDKIGVGGYGEVYKAVDMQTGEKVAIKFFEHLFQDCFDTKRILREVYLLKRMNHRNIIKMKDVFSTNNYESFKQICVVLEYMPYDLKKFIDSNKNLEMNILLKIFWQIVQGLSYLKQRKIIHRDLKPSNILIDEHYNVKICDFGLARGLHLVNTKNKSSTITLLSNIGYSLTPKSINNVSLKESFRTHKKGSQFNDLPKTSKRITKSKEPQLQKVLSHHVGTRYYRAPEIILLSSNYDFQSDIWGLGCVFAELLSMRHPNSLKGPLFPGHSCYPMSPLKGIKEKMLDPWDQLIVIFEILGTPTVQELDFIENPSAKEYVRNITTKKSVDLKKLYLRVEPVILNLMRAMLEFNPKNRPSIESLLENDIFEGFRSEMEEEANEEFDENECKIDFETDNFYLDRKDLSILFFRELGSFHALPNKEKFDEFFEVLLEEINEN